jgi:murein DD-endopeptidase MepM/ murein hydrolase activator NlpD
MDTRPSKRSSLRWRHRHFLLVLAVLAVAPVLCTNASLYDRINARTRQLNGLNAEIGQAKSRLGELMAQDLALKAQLDGLDRQLQQVADNIRRQTARLEMLNQQVREARALLAAKTMALRNHEQAFAAQMRAMYKDGEATPLELILSANDFTDLLNRIHFFEAVMREDRRQVVQLREERVAIAALKADLESKQAQQAQVVGAIKQQQAELRRTRAQQAALREQIRDLEAQVQEAIDEMQAQREQVQAQLRQLIQESLRARSSGRFSWPMTGYISQGFGCTRYILEPYAPNCATRHFHSGIDIVNDWGTPVRAADGGIAHNRSMNCFWGGGLCGFGRYVIVVHAGGFTTLYGHLSRWAVAEGSVVSPGQVIGYEGSSGNSTGPHLHFEIDLNGSPVNPLAYLP